MKIKNYTMWAVIATALFDMTALAQKESRSSQTAQTVRSIVSLAREAAAAEPAVEKIIPEVSRTGPPGTYYSVQLDDQPPLPYNPFPEQEVIELDAARQVYLLNDLGVDYELLSALNELVRESLGMSGPRQVAGASSQMAAGPGEPVLGISSPGGGLLNFTMTNAEPDAVYDLYFVNDLRDQHWQWRRLGYASELLASALNRIERRHEVAHAHFQCPGNPPQRFNRDLLLRPLDFPDIIPVKISLLSKFFLAEFGLSAFSSDGFTDDPINLLRGRHGGQPKQEREKAATG